MRGERDLEARLRRDALAVRSHAEPDAGFHHRIMARVSATATTQSSGRRSFRLVGQVAFAAGLIVVVLGFAVAVSRLNSSRTGYRNTGAPALVGAMMAADPVHRQVVVFGGGADPAAPKNDTWIWDGSSWKRQHPVGSPPARSFGSMVFDAARGTIVLFGGTGASRPQSVNHNFNDTWIWDGAVWREAHSRQVPPATNGAAMTYDPALRMTVLLNAGATWLWDGVEWTEGLPAPPGMGHGPMAYAPATNDVVALALSQASGPVASTETWRFAGKPWSRQPGADLPAAGSPVLLAEDPATHTLIGVDGRGRTWSWNSSHWTIRNVNRTSTAAGSAMTYDPARHLVLLYGGQVSDNDNRPTSDLWAWDGNRWTLLQGG